MIKRVNGQLVTRPCFLEGGEGGGEGATAKGEKRNALYNFTKFKSPAAPTVL